MSGQICGAVPNPAWNCIQNTRGAQVLAALYSLDSNGQLISNSANGIIASVVSYGFAVATQQCNQDFIVSQRLELNCDDAIIGERVANNVNCIACKRAMQQLVDARTQLDNDAHNQNPSYSIPTASPDLLKRFNGPGNDTYANGVCDVVCKQCVARDVQQRIDMNISASCQTNTTSFVTAFTSGMSTQAEYELTQQQTALQRTGYVLDSQQQVKDLAIQMSNAISEMTTNISRNHLQQSALNIQQTVIDPQSTSVMLSHLTQTITVSMMASLASSTYNDARMKDAINYQLLQQQIQMETSFTALLKQLEASTATMKDLVVTLIGEILVSVIAILLVGILGFVFYIRFVMSRVVGQ